jgi:hypothetical protein
VSARACQRFGQAFNEEASVDLGSTRFVHRILIYYTLDFDLEGLEHMRSKIFLTFALGVGVLSAACGGETTPTGGTNTNLANTNAASPAANAANLDPVKKPEAATTNNAPTLTPVVQTYYEALKKKDDALIKSVMSQEFIKNIESDMKEEKRAGIAAYMAEFDTIPDKPVEVRNEKIEGNDAVAEIKGGAYINWTPFAFVNEGGKWKFTGGSPVLK